MTDDDFKDPYEARLEAFAQKKLAEQEWNTTRSEITFSGGPFDGEKMNLPQGVNELFAEQPDGTGFLYVRDDVVPENFVPGET